MATIAVYSLKDGVGKTMPAVNLASRRAVGEASPRAAAPFLDIWQRTERRPAS
ncbi:MAG: hypothetical protein QM688_04690 [Sphingomonas bacterium]